MATVYMHGKARYAKVFEHNRDMGENLQPGDQKDKIELTQGQYIVDLVVTPEEKVKAISNGIPDKGMIGMRWKTNNDGEAFYKASRKHFNPNMTDRDTGEKGVIQGPPQIMKKVDGENVKWDFDEDGFIGNDSEVVLKMNVWQDKIVDLQAILVLDHVEFVPDGGNDDGFGGY